MTNETKNRIRQIYGIVLSVSLLAAGICLMVSCVDIYCSGNQPFSREAVAEHFSAIAVPVYLCLALVIGGFILDLLLPANSKKTAPGKQNALILKRLQEKTDLSACDEALRSAIQTERKKRGKQQENMRWLRSFCVASCFAHLIAGDRFQLPDINGSMLSAMRVLAYWLVIPFAYAVFTAYSGRKSIQREIDLLKTAPAEAKRTVTTAPEAPKKDHTPKVRCILLLAAVALLLYGYFTGGTMDVLTKAINICTECVGLG